ncbi:hypothetical protein CBF_0636 [Clostridium botulinum F str. 230613]|nr:hypothetical protein CBF_0636 [Clostridium botulinum F str. 230613]
MRIKAINNFDQYISIKIKYSNYFYRYIFSLKLFIALIPLKVIMIISY